ncbi:hypothetical protein HUU62_08745 [Rhodoferax sp. 4810]|uniref:NTP pyrophosphohydrolase MazG-like domain-containing protein n=1 Tax=Thiospirillum jenense TaxID=1653858 RepID=A0A839HER3_9GAMM|nr:MazG nucleotide pyrophosphohydrolase domain-containing protein [Thiospirillum jenense]MBB1074497.1 hypothetical protein [Rhodoferax jenense]MBB1125519.1 hypothetical protein [Thiospirillum jenense]
MNIHEYEESVIATSNYQRSNESLFIVTVALLGELGEYANKVKKASFKKTLDNALVIDDLKSELGDVLWYLTELCHQHDLSLDDVARANADKVTNRKQKGLTYNQ